MKQVERLHVMFDLLDHSCASPVTFPSKRTRHAMRPWFSIQRTEHSLALASETATMKQVQTLLFAHSLHVLDGITELFEVVMLLSRLARYPSVRPILKEFGHEVHTLRFQSRCYGSPSLGFKDWKVWLPVWQFGDGWPSLCGRSPQDPKDLLELIGISVSREQRTAIHHLCKDTPNWPNVYWGGVLARTHQHIWGSIPQGHHLMRVAPHRNAESPGQAKVRKLQRALSIDK